MMAVKFVKRRTQFEYDQLLDAFDAMNTSFGECVDYLVGLGSGISRGQATSAAYQYRREHGLIGT